LKADPERLAAQRARERAYQRRRRAKAKTDPDVAARMRANAQRHRERLRADPVRYQAWLENRRIDSRLRQERKGRELVPAAKRAPEDVERPVVPVEPFAVWVDGLAAGPSAIAAGAGIPERRLWSIRNREQRFVSVDTVDRALLALGEGLRFGDLYPLTVPLSVPISLASEQAFAFAGSLGDVEREAR
jgi:hypothetical protein